MRGMLGNLHLGRTGQHQRRRVGDERGVLLEVLEQRVAALVAIDAAEIEHVVAGDADAPATHRSRTRCVRRRLEPMPIIADGAAAGRRALDTSASSSGVRNR